MGAADQLSDFVRKAMEGGHGEERIRSALTQTGWSPAEIDTALAGWQPVDDLPAVPRPRAYVSAREAMLYTLLMVALAVVCWHVLSLGFHVVDTAIPDLSERGYVDNWSMRFSIAAIIAFLPIFVLLDHRMAARLQGRELRRRSQVRRIFASITVLIAALVVLGDVVAIIYALLSGDLTLRFIVKAVLVGGVALLVAACYHEDLDG
ncbi:hypothetical protein JJJ17_05445 [Paracoccus caeni]|uniref:DUF5671 domain-containing protein n=1 Tax=Paracoccus caeni TaxID=657651 RepID=A0A934SE96_9RHOB|nr:hypothetical protein [Paracoccus caeni]